MRCPDRRLLVLNGLFSALCLMLSAAASPLSGAQGMETRTPAVAGAFYPADSLELGRQVRALLGRARPAQPSARPLGLVCPHAGYVFSGGVAAAGYRQLEGRRYTTVIVVAPSHREYFTFCSVYEGEAYSTPLGTVELDRELAAALVEAGGELVRFGRRGHDSGALEMGEHSLEVQLPFLQVALGNFRLVPVVMGHQSEELCRGLGRALARVVSEREDVLLVASSDLSHFHDYEQAGRLDRRFAGLVEELDPEGLDRALGSGEAEACGSGPVLAVMLACRELGANRAQLLELANSGDVTGDRDRVVGYLSAMFYRQAPGEHGNASSVETMADGKMELSTRERRYLLELARRSIAAAVRQERLPEPEAITPAMSQKRGAFVTIRKRGELRGCIGYIIGMQPLMLAVREMAVAAALRDPRFRPIEEHELGELTLEISVLTPLAPVAELESIQVGRDGLMVRQGQYQGLLLPQVAAEYGWDRESFLSQTCRKAGLPPDAWRRGGLEISSFQAEVFGEETPEVRK